MFLHRMRKQAEKRRSKFVTQGSILTVAHESASKRVHNSNKKKERKQSVEMQENLQTGKQAAVWIIAASS